CYLEEEKKRLAGWGESVARKQITEDEWLVSDDPAFMLGHFRGRIRSHHRKLRLFALACCPGIWDHLPGERGRPRIGVAERSADGGATDEELHTAAAAATAAHEEMFKALGKSGSCMEWAAAYVADPLPFHGAKCMSWMAATPRAYEVRRRLVPCTVTTRRG